MPCDHSKSGMVNSKGKEIWWRQSKTVKNLKATCLMALKQIINIFYSNKVKSVEIWALGSIRNDKKMA